MKRKRFSRLTLNRETLLKLDPSDLRTAAGATAQLGCGNTLNDSCRGSCALGCPTFLSCQTCIAATCNTCHPTACPDC